MTAYIIRRVLQTIPLILGISFLTFAIINLVPTSPLTSKQINPRMRAEDIVRIKENLGLNEPWPKRYVIWLGKFARGDLGLSLINSTPVRDRILAVLPNTLLLSATSFTLALVVSVPLGVVSAVRHNSWFDKVATIGTVAAFAVPTVWLSYLLIIVFAVKFREWGWPDLPVGGMQEARGESGALDRIRHLILPTISLALVQLAGWARYIRSSMLEVIRQDYVRTARAKGLTRRVVLYVHGFRNALLPLVTLVGLSLPDFFAGAFIVETVFAWNGIGRLAVDASTKSDYTMIMGITLMLAALTILGNLVADVAYAMLDPRIRY